MANSDAEPKLCSIRVPPDAPSNLVQEFPSVRDHLRCETLNGEENIVRAFRLLSGGRDLHDVLIMGLAIAGSLPAGGLYMTADVAAFTRGV